MLSLFLLGPSQRVTPNLNYLDFFWGGNTCSGLKDHDIRYPIWTLAYLFHETKKEILYTI